MRNGSNYLVPENIPSEDSSNNSARNRSDSD